MGYMDEYGAVWERGDPKYDYISREYVEKMKTYQKRCEHLEDLAVEVKRFVDMSSLLIGADRIRAILKNLERYPK